MRIPSVVSLSAKLLGVTSACYMPTGNSIDNTINNNNNTIYYQIYLYAAKIAKQCLL